MPAPATATTTQVTATVTGNIAISNKINIPINAKYPLKPGTSLVLDYTFAKSDDHPNPPQGSLSDLTGWIKNTFSADVPLPDTFKDFAVQVTRLHLDTDGNVTVATNFGKIVNDKFDPTWKPFSTLNVVLQNVTLEVDRKVSQ